MLLESIIVSKYIHWKKIQISLFQEMCRLCEEMSRKVYTIDPTVLIPRKLYRKLSPILSSISVLVVCYIVVSHCISLLCISTF